MRGKATVQEQVRTGKCQTSRIKVVPGTGNKSRSKKKWVAPSMKFKVCAGTRYILEKWGWGEKGGSPLKGLLEDCYGEE